MGNTESCFQLSASSGPASVIVWPPLRSYLPWDSTHLKTERPRGIRAPVHQFFLTDARALWLATLTLECSSGWKEVCIPDLPCPLKNMVSSFLSQVWIPDKHLSNQTISASAFRAPGLGYTSATVKLYICIHALHVCVCVCVCVCVIRGGLVTQSCPTLCNPLDCSPPGFPVHGISQARILEWVAISSSRGSFWPRDQTHVSYIAGRFFTAEPSEISFIYNKHTHIYLHTQSGGRRDACVPDTSCVCLSIAHFFLVCRSRNHTLCGRVKKSSFSSLHMFAVRIMTPNTLSSPSFPDHRNGHGT